MPEACQAALCGRVLSGPLLLRGFQKVKKLLLIGLAVLGVFALWRKVQADRAELDLWTEATTGDGD
jgi:hypothetical protein